VPKNISRENVINELKEKKEKKDKVIINVIGEYEFNDYSDIVEYNRITSLDEADLSSEVDTIWVVGHNGGYELL
jgi:hypothetical protein